MDDQRRWRPSALAEKLRSSLGPRWWLWSCLALVGVVTNFGTAAQRLKAIFPSPQPMDFAAYYVGGWAVRLGLSPYSWPPDLLPLMKSTQGVTVPTWPPASPPPWVWLMQVFTPLHFPVAAWLWLVIQLALLAWCTSVLVRLAGYSGWKAALVLLAVVVTFGPVFLCLTLGQNAILLLVGALLLGRNLAGQGPRAYSAATGWMLAVIAKIFPVLWLAAIPFVKRQLALILVASAGLVLGGSWLAQRALNEEYWFRFLPGGGHRFVESVSVDDQSIEARALLFGRSNTLTFTGKDVTTRHEKVWRPPWELSGGVIRLASGLIVLGLGAGVVLVWLRADRRRYGEGLFYLVVLFSLLPIPHIERYNHTALLAAMAWLWGQGPRYRWSVALAYCLVGLSRLNHLWALVFPWPLGALATGTCLYAVLLLGAVIARCAQTNRLSHLETR